MSFIQWCCERGAKSHRKRTKKKQTRKRQSRSWRFSFHKYFTTFFYLFLFFNYFTLSFFFSILFLPRTFTHTHTHDPRHLATLIMYKYYVDALQRHYDPENPRSWKKIYPSCNVSRNVSVVLLFLTYLLSSETTVIGSPLSWQPCLLSIYLLFIVQ